MSSTKAKVNFGIIGYGSIGSRHAKHIFQQAELTAVCDIDPNALKKCKEVYPEIRVYDSIKEFLLHENTLDVVSVCTPNGLHAEHTVLCLRKGFNVLCEKPMALRINDCQKMIEESLLSQKHLFIVKQNRYNPPILLLKQIIDEGKLGNILSAQLNCFWNRNENYYLSSKWKGKKDMDGGILFTQFSHFIDLFLWIMGAAKNVRSYDANRIHAGLIDFEDTLVSIIEFENGGIGTMNFTINSFQKNMEGSITIFGDKGTVKVGGQYLNELEYFNVDGMQKPELPSGNTSNDYGQYQGSMSNHDKVIENVIEVITNHARIAVNGFDGLRTVDLIQRIYASLEHNK